jgi:hypothetical protein
MAKLLSLFYLYGPQCLNILFAIRPFKVVTTIVQTFSQLFTQDQCQKTSEHMPADVLVASEEYRSNFRQRLDVPKDPLHLPELFVLEGHFFGLKIRVGGQHAGIT